MKTTKFMVKVIRGIRAAEYVQRIDRSPIQTTLKRNLALVMGKIVTKASSVWTKFHGDMAWTEEQLQIELLM